MDLKTEGRESTMSEKQKTENEKSPVKVLWIAQSCSLQDEKDNPGLTGRMEPVMNRYLAGRIRLAVAYMADGIHEKKFTQDGIDYFAVDGNMRVGSSEADWETARRDLVRVCEDFQPDIIQCFGAEWPYGQIAESVDIPVVIHMMGFLNIYYLSIQMARGTVSVKKGMATRLKEGIKRLLHLAQEKETEVDRQAAVERRVMSVNRYFLGRTEWDRNIVKYYSPGSLYFHVPEMIKPSVYEAAGQWKYHAGERIRLFSLSSGDDRKGNEIILRTADILKNVLHLDFEWRVAGSRDFFPAFEERTGISHENVGIRLLGMIGSAEIIEEMKSADLFIHPSIMDNSPHAVCEAQLIGLPVIASNVGGVPDLVEKGKTGFLYPYNEPHTLAFLIANVYPDEEKLTAISKTAVKTARERHDPESIALTLFQTYQSIIKDYHGK